VEARQRQRLRLLAVGGGVVLIALAALAMAVRSPGAPSRPALPPAPSSPVASTPSGPTLRALAAAHNLVFGSAANTAALRADPGYRDVLGRQFGAVTAEDAMKWANVEPARGRYRWDDADRVVDFAHRNHQLVYGHALAWYSALPAWLSTVDSAGLAAVLRAHVEDEVSRYRGRVWAWDVVNEAVNADGSLRDSAWLRTLGPDYLAQVFGWAHAKDPSATLFLNDFGMEDVNRKSNAVYAIVKQLRAQGVPVGGVGFQLHWTTDPLPAGFTANLRRFAALGVRVAITEADVRIALPVTFDKLAAQAAVYRQAVAGCLAVAGCVSFTVWGFTDRYSWIPGLSPADGAACLFDTGFQPKAAYAAVLGALK
jgi:endo-1,4-beta-xylanase